MVRGFDDDTGLMWSVQPQIRAISQKRISTIPSLPRTGWHAPGEFPSLRGIARISLDVETCDPNLRDLGPGTIRGDAYICGLAMGADDGRRWYFPTRHEGGHNLDEDLVWRWAREELNSFTGDVVGARLIYDLDHLWNYGVTLPKVNRFYDVQIAEPLLDDNRLQYKLESLSQDYLGEGKNEELLEVAAEAYGLGKSNDVIKANLYRFPADYVGLYGESDVDRPLRILDLQMKELEKYGLLKLFDIESRLIPVLLSMRRRGVRVDVSGAEQVRGKLLHVRDNHLANVRRIAGKQAELMAPASFAKALIDRGIIPPRTPKSGNFSITSSWLKANEGDELIDAIQAGRKVNTIINTFIDGHVLGHAINGRIHCEFVQLRDGDGGTIARFSSRNPNLQNIPARDEELAALVRGLFLPDEGDQWERHDQSQMEYRLLVHYARGAGASDARQRYRDNPKTDFHKFCAEMLGVDPEDSKLRKRVKNTNFAKSYGAQAPRLAVTFGCSIEEAKSFIQTYESKLPFTKTTFEAVQKQAGEQGHIKSILGRYSRFPLWEPISNSRTKKDQRKIPLPKDQAIAKYGSNIQRAHTYRAMNNLLQFSNADYIKKAMVDIWEAGLCKEDILGAFLLQVHDELDYSVPNTAIGNEAAKEAKHLIEVAIPLRVPVLVEAQRGSTWGECA